MDNSGRQAFDKNHVFEALRRPHTGPGGHHQIMPTHLVASQRLLSPNAPEFVPKTYGNQMPNQQVDQRALAGMMNRLAVQDGGHGKPHHHQGHHQHQQQPQHHHHHNHHHQHHRNNNQQHFQGEQSHNNRYRGGNGGGRGGGGGYSSVQNRLNFADNRHSQQHAQQHQHDVYQQQRQQDSSQQPQNEPQQTEEEQRALMFMDSIIGCLIEDPGSYDSSAARIVNVFEKFGSNETVLSISMEIIFKRSIEEQNFRYMGAKLYGLLDMLDLREDSVFRTLLKLQLQYHRTELLEYMQNEQVKVRGTTLFLAELYMQLRNDGARLREIASTIIYSINQLLQKTGPENIKCICMALKLSGYDLEFDCPEELSQIMATLEATQGALDVSTNRVLESVLNLRKIKWGRKSEAAESLSLQKMPQETLRISDEPVFYGPDGEIITEEEQSFLISNMHPEDHLDDGGDSDLELDPEMDEETGKAFKDFLKSNNQRSNS